MNSVIILLVNFQESKIMWIYLIGVIVTIIVMLLGHYILKKDITINSMLIIIFTSIFSWVGLLGIIIVFLILSIVFLSEEVGNKSIIKWKSREKDTQDNLNIVRKVNINSEQIGSELLGV